MFDSKLMLTSVPRGRKRQSHQNDKLSEANDAALHWKALKELFLMVTLVLWFEKRTF
jgi:hypothetical protein